MVVKKRIPTSLKVDPELWEEVKIMAIRTKKNITEYFENALREKLVKDYEVVAVERKMKEQERIHQEQVNQRYQQIVGQDPGSPQGEQPSSQPQPTGEQKLLQWEQQRQQQPRQFRDIFKQDDAHPPKKENETDISLYIPDLEFPANKEQIIDYVKKSDRGKIKLFIVERISNKTFNDKDELQNDIVNSFANNKELRDFMKKGGKDYEVIRCDIITKKDAAHRLTRLYTTDVGV